MSVLNCKIHIQNVAESSSISCDALMKKRKELNEIKIKNSSFSSIDQVENYVIGLCINALMDVDDLTIDKEFIALLMTKSMKNEDITEDEKNELIRLVTSGCFSESEFRKRIVFKLRDLSYHAYLSSNEKKIRLTL